MPLQNSAELQYQVQIVGHPSCMFGIDSRLRGNDGRYCKGLPSVDRNYV